MSQDKTKDNQAETAISGLLSIMGQLRDPITGCPWDLAQSYETIAPHTLEEAYEVYDAIAEGDQCNLKNELGDLLFQLVLHSQLAAEEGSFTFSDVVCAISDKMVRRHPHVFEPKQGAISNEPEAQLKNWEMIKAEEQTDKPPDNTGLLGDIPIALPALMRAEKIQKKASLVGFDWDEIDEVFSKLEEEKAELKSAIKNGDHKQIEAEIGDFLFSITNLGRHLRVNSEEALRKSNKKFLDRFRYMEQQLEQIGSSITKSSLDDMNKLWEKAKQEEHHE